MVMKRLSHSVFFLALAWTISASSAEETAAFDAASNAFFQNHCLRCHNEKEQKGKFRLDNLSQDFTDQPTAQRWGEVLFRINAGEMPPKKEPQPKGDEIGKVVDSLAKRITEGEAARMAKRGPVAHYRLSREEYGYTVYDLLGVHFDVNLPGAFNEDPRWHGFERVGSMLSLSPSHVDRYMKAAETVLERAFPEQPVKAVKQRRDANEGQEKWLTEQGITGRVRWPLWPGARKHLMNTSLPGTYRVRIQLSGMAPPAGRMPHLTLWHQQLKRSVFDQDIIAAEDKPTIIEFEIALPPGGFELVNEVPLAFPEVGNHTLNVLNGGGSVFTSSRDSRNLNPTGYKLFDDSGQPVYPTLLVDWVEWEGPLTSDADLQKRTGMIPAKSGDLAQARQCLKHFASRAWRRNVSEGELDRYIKIIESELTAKEPFHLAYRSALVAILTSKNFYYLEEGSPDKKRNQVNDWELASRLSFFLWSSLPDEELLTAAQSGKLHEPEVLRAQLSRMLADGKARRFSDTFPRQWLQLHRVGMFPPDPKLYPDYDKWLEQSMTLETTHYFGQVFAKNLSLREFLTSDWTMVNPRLALHYHLPPVAESGFQRVKLKPEDHRGGLLTQAAVLMLTSDGTRHRPVHRGVWVSEAIFGRTPPPPPPNVQPLEPTPSNKPKATIRMQLEAHATHAICASCHQKIDPLGFAFDNFDAVGQWRMEEQVPGGQGANPPVNATGTLADGRSFNGADEFKQLLTQDLDRFASAFVEQLATFALRRVMTIDDAAQIQAIAMAAKKDDYKLRTVIEQFVMSELFQKR